MKTKPLFFNLHLAFILLPIAYCLLPAFVFAQPAKPADKPSTITKTAAPPSIIKKVDIPWPASAVVDEKGDKVFVMSTAGENSAVFVLNGKDNSIIKKIGVKESFNINVGANGMIYNPNTQKLYALTNYHKDRQEVMIAVVDAKSHDLKTVKFSDPEEKWCCTSLSINLDKSGNMVYTFPSSYPYILAFNGSSLKLMEKIKHNITVYFAQIDEKGDFIYLTADKRFIKFDVKAKKIAGSIPIDASIDCVPYIDEKNGLVYVGTAYKLYIIDLKTFKIKDDREDIPVSNIFGSSIALNPTTNHLFIPTYGDSVSVIDVPSMKMLATIKVGQTVRSIAVNSKTNRVYVTLVNEVNKVIVIQDR